MLPIWSYPIAWMLGVGLGGWLFDMNHDQILGGLAGVFATSVLAYKQWVK